jgi:peptide/nickel transport system substrate-binding protein
MHVSANSRLAGLLVALLSLALLASSCGGGDVADDSAEETADNDSAGTAVVPTITTTVAPTVEGGITPGGTLRVGLGAEVDGLNPGANSMVTSTYLIDFTMLEPLAYFDSEGNWFPWLAESFERMDGSDSWRMTLRDGITFHDGSGLDADDVIAMFNAQLKDPLIGLALQPSFPLPFEGPAIEKIDELTVQFNPLGPTEHFPVNLTSQLGMIVPSEYTEATQANSRKNQTLIGTGPFMFESRVQDDRTTVVRNPNWWGGEVYLDGIEFIIQTDQAIAADRLAAGDLDVVITSNPDAILTMRESDNVNRLENLLSSDNNLMMNTSKPPFDDIRVRQALTFATDRDGFSALISQGTSEQADTMFHPDLIWSNPDVVQEGNAPELSPALVDSYCADVPDNCTDGRINMEFQHSGPSVVQTRIADLLTSSWQEFFNVTVAEVLQDQLVSNVAIGEWQVVSWRQFGSIDPDNEVIWLQCATADKFIALNWVRYCDEERDALMLEQRQTTDLDRRVEIWHEIQVNMNESYAYIFMTHANWTIGSHERVQNLCPQFAPTGEEIFCSNAGVTFFHDTWIAE